MSWSRSMLLVAKNATFCVSMETPCSHAQTRCMSRVKQRFTGSRHFWMKEKRANYPESLSSENESFVREVVSDRYESPLRESVPQPAVQPFQPNIYRCGLIARKIGVQPMWLKNGKYVTATLLHVSDNHVVRYVPPETLEQNEVWRKRWKNMCPQLGGLVVGADQQDPRKFTKEYANMFLEAGIMPTTRLTRFTISPNAALPPGTRLRATHFNVGDYVDVSGKTVERGFQGVMKRWGFAGMPATHGTTKSHRRPGGIGSGREKSRVWPGQKMPGHMGSQYRTLRAQKILRINTKYDIIYVMGPAVPGDHNNYVLIHDTLVRSRKRTEPAPVLTPEEAAELPENIYHEDVHPMDAQSIKF